MVLKRWRVAALILTLAAAWQYGESGRTTTQTTDRTTTQTTDARSASATQGSGTTWKSARTLDVPSVVQPSDKGRTDWRTFDNAEIAFWLSAEAFNGSQSEARRQMLDAWAQHTGSSLDPLTYALVDPEESLRTRAEQLFEYELLRR